MMAAGMKMARRPAMLAVGPRPMMATRPTPMKAPVRMMATRPTPMKAPVRMMATRPAMMNMQGMGMRRR